MRIGIVGCGRVAQHHMRFATESKDCKVLGLVDPDLDKARALAARYGIDRCYESLDELLDAGPLDVLHILSPPRFHYDQTKTAIAHGLNVLIEKPMAMRAAEVADLYERAENRRVLLCPDFIQLFHPLMLQASVLIATGELGPVTHCAFKWAISTKYDIPELYEPVDLPWAFQLPGGLFHNYITHPLYEVVHWLGRPQHIMVRPRSLGILPQGLTDHLEIVMEGAEVTAQVILSFGLRPGLCCLRLFCRRGTVVVDFETRTVLVEREHGLPRTIERATANFRQAYQLSRNNLKNVIYTLRGKLVPYEGLRALIQAYYGAIRGHTTPPVSRDLAIAVSEAEDAVTAGAGKVRLDLSPRPSRQTHVSRNSRIVITGATGYLGSELVARLVEAGYCIRALARPLSRTEELEGLGVEVVRGDVRDYASLLRAFAGADIVVHAAAGLRGSQDFVLGSCVAGTRNVAQAAQVAGVKRVIYISSMMVYDFTALRRERIISEQSPLERFPELRGLASMAKREAENVALEHLANPSTPWTVIRPSVIFGNGRDLAFPLGARLGNWVVCFGSPGLHLRLIHVTDVATAVLKIIESPGTRGHVFVLSHPEAITIRQYIKDCLRKSRYKSLHVICVPHWIASLGRHAIRILRGVTGKGPVISRQRFAYLYADALVDSTSLMKETGWQPQAGLLEQLATEALGADKGPNGRPQDMREELPSESIEAVDSAATK